MKVYAFVGVSGSGKSHHAQNVAFENGIDYIIDDALLINGTKVVAGKSAKTLSGVATAPLGYMNVFVPSYLITFLIVIPSSLENVSLFFFPSLLYSINFSMPVAFE